MLFFKIACTNLIFGVGVPDHQAKQRPITGQYAGVCQPIREKDTFGLTNQRTELAAASQ